MAGIGMAFSAAPDWTANIEDTLFHASNEALEADDLRVFSMLVAWLDRNVMLLNADRMFALAKASSSTRVRAFWAALATWQRRDARFRRFAKLHEGGRIDLLRSGTAFQLSRGGEDGRFKESPLRVPARSVRVRDADALPVARLAEHRRDVYWRVLLGPSYQADLWTQLEATPGATVADLARRTHAGFATAWNAKRKWELLETVRPPRQPRPMRLSPA
jgi:hypothetical protein